MHDPAERIDLPEDGDLSDIIVQDPINPQAYFMQILPSWEITAQTGGCPIVLTVNDEEIDILCRVLRKNGIEAYEIKQVGFR